MCREIAELDPKLAWLKSLVLFLLGMFKLRINLPYVQ